MSVKAQVEGGKIVKVIVEGYEFPCDIPLEKWGEAESLFKKLVELGAFRKTGSSLLSDMKAFVSSLKPNERKVLEVLSTREFTPITNLRNLLNMSGRQLAGVLANITKKARKYGLISSMESIIEVAKVGGEQCYRLKEKFKDIKDLMRSGS